MAVEVKNLWKTFKIPHERRDTVFENIANFFRPNNHESLTVLKNINFRVGKGECVGIIGDNGSGKSTLLKIIANIMRPTKGEVSVEGKIASFLELGVGFNPDLSVRENIEVYGSIMGLTDCEIKDRIPEVLQFSGLKKFEDTKLKNLSSGMQVRLAFSTAIQTEPDILLVDEALAVGDMEFQQKCFEIFDQYKKKEVTILFVSHDLSAVRRFCDKTLLLRNGEQLIFGDTNKVIDRYIYKSNGEDAITDESLETEPNLKRRTRWGDRKIEIVGVTFIDKNGSPNENFISGDPLIARIFYNSQEKIKSPIFGIIFYNEDIYCFGTNTELRGYDTGLIEGQGYVDFEIKDLPLLEGRVEVTVAVGSWDYRTNYDWHDRLYSFNVYNPTRDLGIFSIEGSWSASKDVGSN